MKKQTIFSSLALATGLALAGCSSNAMETSQTPSAPPVAEQLEKKQTLDLNQAFYAQTPYGSHITVDFSAPAPTDIESYRKAAGIDPGSYAKVDLDNREGTDTVAVYKVVFFDEDGKSYEFDDVMDHVSEWGTVTNYDTDPMSYTLQDGTPITEAQDSALNEQSSVLSDKYLNATNASVHEVTSGYIASAETELPEKITAIEVWPGGIIEDPIYMVLASEKDGYKVPEASEQKEAQSDEDAEKEYQEWMADGSDCSDAVIRELGKKTMVVVTFECAFNEAEEAAIESPAPVQETPQIVPDSEQSNDVGVVKPFTYDEAYAAWQGGMPYYEAFCANYTPTTDGGRSQCEGINAGTVDYTTGEYIGDQVPSMPAAGQGFGCHKDENGNDYCIDPAPNFIP